MLPVVTAPTRPDPSWDHNNGGSRCCDAACHSAIIADGPHEVTSERLPSPRCGRRNLIPEAGPWAPEASEVSSEPSKSDRANLRGSLRRNSDLTSSIVSEITSSVVPFFDGKSRRCYISRFYQVSSSSPPYCRHQFWLLSKIRSPTLARCSTAWPSERHCWKSFLFIQKRPKHDAVFHFPRHPPASIKSEIILHLFVHNRPPMLLIPPIQQRLQPGNRNRSQGCGHFQHAQDIWSRLVSFRPICFG